MDGKWGVALVTGAGSGIGRSIAEELSRRGWTVVSTDVDGDAAEATAAITGGRVSTLDVTDPAAVDACVAWATSQVGPLQLCVANAGVSKMQRFLEIAPDDAERTLAVNTLGVFHTGQAAARAMAEQGNGGVIVNVASMAGKQGRVPYLADYVASKFAVVGLTQAMAYELAPLGIRVNSVCPGFVDTPMQERELAWEAALSGSSPDAVRAGWIAATPLGRLERPRDVARVVAFLAGPDAEFMTGEAVAVNGGAYMD